MRALYFGVFDALVTSKDAAFRFNGRNRRPPLDPSMPSFCIRSFFMISAGRRNARDASGGRFLYVTLADVKALDLPEEFRSVVADRLTLLINLGR